MSDIIRYDDGFNIDALSNAYETGILRKEDFATDEHWSLAMDIFSEQTTDELEIEGFEDRQEALQMVADFTTEKHLTDWVDLCAGIEQEFGVSEAADLEPEVFEDYTEQLFKQKGYTHSSDLFSDDETGNLLNPYGAVKVDEDKDWNLDDLI